MLEEESAAMQQCFSLITNQQTVLSATINQRNKQGMELVNSVLSSLPTYAMCSLQLPVAVLDYIDRAR
jgi:hypothetical protein